MGEKGDDCIKILLISIWVYPYCGNCYGQPITPDAVQQISNLRSGIKAFVPIFLEVHKDNMVLDMAGYILSPIPCSLFTIIHWCKMPLCHLFWTCAAWCIDTDLYPCRSDLGCHRPSYGQWHTLLYDLALCVHPFLKRACFCLEANVTSWIHGVITIGLDCYGLSYNIC